MYNTLYINKRLYWLDRCLEGVHLNVELPKQKRKYQATCKIRAIRLSVPAGFTVKISRCFGAVKEHKITFIDTFLVNTLVSILHGVTHACHHIYTYDKRKNCPPATALDCNSSWPSQQYIQQTCLKEFAWVVPQVMKEVKDRFPVSFLVLLISVSLAVLI